MNKMNWLKIITALLVAWEAGCIPGAAQAATPPATAVVKGNQASAAGLDRQQKWTATLAAAKKEGSLSVYGDVRPEARQALTNTFEAKYGIKMEFVVGKSAELATRWERESIAGLNPVDIFHMGGITSTLVMKPKGAFGPIEPNLMLSEVVDPKVWQDGALRYLDKDKKILPLNRSWTSYVAVNTDLVKEGQLKSYKDILNKEWKGKVILFDPTIGDNFFLIQCHCMKGV